MDKHSAHLTVMTMNIRFGLANDGINKWNNRKALVEKILDQYPADFIGIQEANHFQAEFLTSVLPNHKFIGWYNKSVETWQSNLLFYHQSWQCRKHSHYFLSHTPDRTSKLEGAKWPRQCVIGLFKEGDRQLVAANTHFDFDIPVQTESATLTIDFLSGFPEKLPVFITGDFNCNPGSPAYNIFKTHGFSDIFEGENVTTFHAFEGRSTGEHLDWILYGKRLTPVSRHVIKDCFSNRYPSDHFPVIAKFEWKKD